MIIQLSTKQVGFIALIRF